MQLSRRASWFLIAFAVWSWFIWVTLVKNVWHDSRSWSHGATGFFIVHVVLAAISLVLGTAIGWLGWRGLRAHPAPHQVEPVRGDTDATDASDRQTVR